MSTPVAGERAQKKTAAPPDVNWVRAQFPSLKQMVNGHPAAFLDAPAGTQVPQRVIDAMREYFEQSNANTCGAFATSRRTDAMIAGARAAMADFLRCDADEVFFGPNMTTITFALARGIGRDLQPGDEIVVTTLDHDANVAPWRALEERGVVVRQVDIREADCTLDIDDLRLKITSRTKLVAVGYAANAVGTVNDVETVVGWAREVGALSFIDAVQFAPHGPIDVQALGCDFLVCSAYKFFGPHLGILYGRLPLLTDIAAYKVRPSDPLPPGKWETGTQNHECLAGLIATIEYLAELGRAHLHPYADRFPGMSGRRLELHAAMAAIQEQERVLAARLLAGLAPLPGVRIHGLTAPEDLPRRVPTIALTVDGHTPRELAEALAERGIFCWDGNYYALTLMERLGLEETGGALRIGLAHYNTPEEIDRMLAALHEILGA
jgi:cysteine desulfurase family protein (TIGR01976 family)